MKKLVIPIVLMLIFSLILTACATSQPTAQASTPAKTSAAATSAASSPAAAQVSTSTSKPVSGPIKLIFGAIIPETDAQATTFKAVADAIKAKSGGQVTVEYSWGGALGDPKDFYDLVVKGVCDVGMVFPSYAADRFPLTNIFQGAWKFPDEEVSSLTFWEFHKKGYFQKEFADTKLIYVGCGGGEASLCTASKPVTYLVEARGLKIATTGGQMSARVQAMGCVPVPMSLTETYQAIKKGTVDGVVTDWGGMKTLKLAEVTKFATIPGAGGSPMTVVMNMQTFNKLPEAVQKVIDEMWTDGEFTKMAAKTNKQIGSEGRFLFTEQGGKILNWTLSSQDNMDKAFAPLWTTWIADTEAKGLPGKKLVNDIYSYMKGLGIEKPTFGYVRGE